MMIKALEHLTRKEKLTEQCLLSLERRQLGEILLIYLVEGNEATRAGLFSVWPSDRTRGNGCYFKYEKFHLQKRKSFFTLTVIEHWNRLPRESLSLEIFKTCMEMVSRNLLWLPLL